MVIVWKWRAGFDRTYGPRRSDAYKRRCAITGESTLPVLEAAHIRPFAKSGVNEVSNGMLLRSDFHRLFDAGLVTVTPELRVEVSTQIKEQWFNGQPYYLIGYALTAPKGAESEQESGMCTGRIEVGS